MKKRTSNKPKSLLSLLAIPIGAFLVYKTVGTSSIGAWLIYIAAGLYALMGFFILISGKGNRLTVAGVFALNSVVIMGMFIIGAFIVAIESLLN